MRDSAEARRGKAAGFQEIKGLGGRGSSGEPKESEREVPDFGAEHDCSLSLLRGSPHSSHETVTRLEDQTTAPLSVHLHSDSSGLGEDVSQEGKTAVEKVCGPDDCGFIQGLSLLEKKSTSDRTERYYNQECEDLLQFVRKANRKFKTPGEIDQGLTD